MSLSASGRKKVRSLLKVAKLMALCCSIGFTAETQAAILTWDTVPGNGTVTGGVGTWNTTNSNWTTDAGATNISWPTTGTDNDAVFGGTGGAVAIAAGGVTANEITINTTGYSLTTGPLTLNGNTPTITVTTGTSTISSLITGTGGLTKAGSGTLQLTTATNAYKGDVFVNAGTLNLNGAGNFIPDSALLTIASGATVTSTAHNEAIGALTGAGTWAGGAGGGQLAVLGNQDASFSGTVSHSNGNAWTKSGTSIQTLSGSSSSTAGVVVQGGTLRLDFAARAGLTNIINNNPLTMAGGTLSAIGKDAVINSQAVSSTTFYLGSNTISATSGSGGTMNITLAAISRNVGSTVNFSIPASGSISTTTTNTNGILGTWATIGSGASTQYATGGGAIAGLTGTTAVNADAMTTATVNYEYSLAGGTDPLTAARTAHTIRYSGAGQVIDLGATGAFNLTANGILNAGTGTLTIQRSGTSTGTLIAGSNNELIVNTANSDINISTPISGSARLTKTGSGTLSLSGTNSYTLPTAITQGVLSVNSLTNGGSGSTLGASANIAANLLINGGTLRYTGNGANSTDRLFTLGTEGGTLDASGANTMTFSNTGSIAFFTDTSNATRRVGDSEHVLTLTGSGNGSLAAVFGNQSGGLVNPDSKLVKSGTGTWTLTAASSYTGSTTINGGTLNVMGTLAGNGPASILMAAPDDDITDNPVLSRRVLAGASYTLGSATGLGSTAVSLDALTTGTTASILAGTNSSALPVNVTMQWRMRMPTEALASNSNAVLSDVVDLKGTGSDVFLLEMSYNDAALNALSLNENSIAISGELRLGWFDKDTNQWTTAVDGNTSGSSHFEGPISSATFLASLGASPLSSKLGSYGVDPTTDTVWAVLNHNSEFAVIPEPSTWAILVCGGVLMIGLRRKTAKN